MKPASANITNTGTLGNGASTVMTIQRDAMAHIMSILTNLYSDTPLAVLREYATNALDAHREVRLDRPIEVTLPFALKPTLVIEDFGVGMSTDDVLSLYSSYGASTKRETNEQTGMLGVGSKSALAYTSQFTVRARKGGVETTALVYLNDNGEGQIKVVDTKAVPVEQTGVRIEVPVKSGDADKFVKAARELFLFWRSEDVSVKGVTIKSMYDDPKIDKMSDMSFFGPSGFTFGMPEDGRYYGYRERNVKVVQGGVPYPVEKEKLTPETREVFDRLPLRERDIVLVAPIGTVQFTPSREAVNYTPNTDRALRTLAETWIKDAAAYITERVSKQADKTKALGEYERLSFLAPGVAITYRGETVPSSIPCVTFATDTARRASGTRHKSLPSLSQMQAYDIVVYGATDHMATDKGSYSLRVNCAGKLTGTYSLCDRWYGRNNAKEILIIVGDLPEGFDWYGVKAVHIDDTKPPRMSGPKGVSQAKTDYQERLWRHVGQHVPWNDAMKKVDPENEKVVYFSRKQQLDHYQDLNKAPKDWTLILVPGNQHSRFAREFPKAMTLEQAAEKIGKDAKIVLDEAATTYIQAGHRWGADLHKKRAEILDSDLRSVLEWTEKEPARVKERNRLLNEYQWLGVQVNVTMSATPTFERVQRKYAAHVGNYRLSPKEMLTTVNALYTYTKESK